MRYFYLHASPISLLAIVIAAFLVPSADATRVHFTKFPALADYKVYFCEYIEHADYTVYYSSGMLDGSCVIIPSTLDQAEVVLYKTRVKSEADFILFESGYRFDASLNCPF